jgi:hypothetical protein
MPGDRRRPVVSTTASMLILVLCPFLPAGTWAWARGWLFLFALVVASIVGTLYLRRVQGRLTSYRSMWQGRKRVARVSTPSCTIARAKDNIWQ